MLTLFAVVGIAVMVTVAAKVERARPWGPALVGALCLVLGVQTTAVLTASSFDSVAVGSALMAAALTEDVTEVSPADQEVTETLETATPSDAPEVADGKEVRELSLGDLEVKPSDEISESAPAAPRTESVQSITHVVSLTPNPPDWLNAKPTWKNETYRMVIAAGPHFRPQQCDIDLNEQLSEATKEFINDYLRNSRASSFVRYSLPDLRHQVVRDTFEEQLETSIAVMNRTHALLEFDRKFCTDLERRWGKIKATSRLMQTGMGGGIVLLLISTLFSYFKFDTATKGYYTGRLQFAAAAAILALVAASVLLAKWIPWM